MGSILRLCSSSSGIGMWSPSASSSLRSLTQKSILSSHSSSPSSPLCVFPRCTPTAPLVHTRSPHNRCTATAPVVRQRRHWGGVSEGHRHSRGTVRGDALGDVGGDARGGVLDMKGIRGAAGDGALCVKNTVLNIKRGDAVLGTKRSDSALGMKRGDPVLAIKKRDGVLSIKGIPGDSIWGSRKSSTVSASAVGQSGAADGITESESRRESEGGSEGEGGRVVITTPLYYVNAVPHMGSAYPTIAADALSRFHRLRGKEVVFVTGTDEHGEKIALAAAAAGRSPKEHCDAIASEYQHLWTLLDIKYDRFIRTTNERHEAIVKQFYERCESNGDIFRAQYEGLYCVACEEYKDEKDLSEGQCCPVHLKPCEQRSEDNLFFALSKYQKALDHLFLENPDFVRPSFRKNEVMAWVEEGVRDFSISRATVEWGIPVPGVPEQTIYVWFDALLGYISALLEEGDPPDLSVASGRGWPAHVHIIGKDILRFHAVYWPAMLMSAGLPTPKAVFGHGFLTKDGIKMGKSLGNTLDPEDLVSRYGSDAVRYFFLKEIEFGRDGDFSHERFMNIVNANLANTLGNLVNRTLGLLWKNCAGVIPVDTDEGIPVDHPLRLTCAQAVAEAAEKYEKLEFAGACNALIEAAASGNVLLEERAPWTKFKKGSEEDKAAARSDLAAVLEMARCIAVALSPVTPQLSANIITQLLGPGTHRLTWEDTVWGGLKEGQQTSEPIPVFKKLEDPSSEAEPALKAKGKAKQPVKSAK